MIFTTKYIKHTKAGGMCLLSGGSCISWFQLMP